MSCDILLEQEAIICEIDLAIYIPWENILTN